MLKLIEKRNGVKDLFECSCGRIKEINRYNVASGAVSSCGCKRILQARINGKKQITHGMTNTKIFRVWDGIKKRASSKRVNSKDFNRYKGRGISICSEWEDSFESFYEWAKNSGYKEGLQIDRIDNDGNYEPSNCRWVTVFANSMNRSTNLDKDKVMKAELMYKQGYNISKIAKELDMKYSGLYQRLTGRRGAEKIVTILKDK